MYLLSAINGHTGSVTPIQNAISLPPRTLFESPARLIRVKTNKMHSAAINLFADHIGTTAAIHSTLTKKLRISIGPEHTTSENAGYIQAAVYGKSL